MHCCATLTRRRGARGGTTITISSIPVRIIIGVVPMIVVGVVAVGVVVLVLVPDLVLVPRAVIVVAVGAVAGVVVKVVLSSSPLSALSKMLD